MGICKSGALKIFHPSFAACLPATTHDFRDCARLKALETHTLKFATLLAQENPNIVGGSFSFTFQAFFYGFFTSI